MSRVCNSCQGVTCNCGKCHNCEYNAMFPKKAASQPVAEPNAPLRERAKQFINTDDFQRAFRLRDSTEYWMIESDLVAALTRFASEAVEPYETVLRASDFICFPSDATITCQDGQFCAYLDMDGSFGGTRLGEYGTLAEAFAALQSKGKVTRSEVITCTQTT